MGGFTQMVSTVRLVRAELPSGIYPRPHMDEGTRARAVEELWDALDGPVAHARGLSTVEIVTATGRYVVLRDLKNGEAVVETVEGQPAPPPDLMPPGWFLLGSPRPGTGRSATRPPGATATAIARASRLRRDGAALAQATEAATANDPSPDHPARPARTRLVAASADLFAREAVTIDDRLRRDHVLASCLADLQGPPEAAHVSSAAASLNRIAGEMDLLAARYERRRIVGAVRAAWPLFLALTLAGCGLVVGAELLAEPSWRLPGIIGAIAALVPVIAARIFDRRTVRTHDERRADLDRQANELLFTARIAIDDDAQFEADELRATADQIARRDLISSLKARLTKIRLDDGERARLLSTRNAIDNGVDDESGEGLAKHREPLLALPGILDAVDDETERRVAGAQRRGFLNGMQRGAAEVLDREACRLETLASVSSRVTAAAALWERRRGPLTAPQATLRLQLLDGLHTPATTDAPSPAAGRPHRRTSTGGPTRRNQGTALHPSRAARTWRARLAVAARPAEPVAAESTPSRVESAHHRVALPDLRSATLPAIDRITDAQSTLRRDRAFRPPSPRLAELRDLPVITELPAPRPLPSGLRTPAAAAVSTRSLPAPVPRPRGATFVSIPAPTLGRLRVGSLPAPSIRPRVASPLPSLPPSPLRGLLQRELPASSTADEPELLHLEPETPTVRIVTTHKSGHVIRRVVTKRVRGDLEALARLIGANAEEIEQILRRGGVAGSHVLAMLERMRPAHDELAPLVMTIGADG